MKTYVLGFLFGNENHVALIRKNKPKWQEGKLNGIGGKVELGETIFRAMRREFKEETGYYHEDWDLFAEMLFEDGRVACFRGKVDKNLFDILKSTTEETIHICGIDFAIQRRNIVPNLKWLIPLALEKYGKIKAEIYFSELQSIKLAIESLGNGRRN